MRSFSNLWYWIALAVLWSTASHWVIGVPFDLIQRARRRGGAAVDEVGALLVLNAQRFARIWHEGGLALTMGVSFALASAMLLGFWYDVEFAQAVVLMVGPLLIVWAMTVRRALEIEAAMSAGRMEPRVMLNMLVLHRLKVQVVGMIAVTFTAFWGMMQNFDIGLDMFLAPAL